MDQKREHSEDIAENSSKRVCVDGNSFFQFFLHVESVENKDAIVTTKEEELFEYDANSVVYFHQGTFLLIDIRNCNNNMNSNYNFK